MVFLDVLLNAEVKNVSLKKQSIKWLQYNYNPQVTIEIYFGNNFSITGGFFALKT